MADDSHGPNGNAGVFAGSVWKPGRLCGRAVRACRAVVELVVFLGDRTAIDVSTPMAPNTWLRWVMSKSK